MITVLVDQVLKWNVAMERFSFWDIFKRFFFYKILFLKKIFYKKSNIPEKFQNYNIYLVKLILSLKNKRYTDGV